MQGHRWVGTVLGFLVVLATAGAALASDRGGRDGGSPRSAPPAVAADAPDDLKPSPRSRASARGRLRSRTAFAGLPARRALAVARRHVAAGDAASATSLRTPIKRLVGGSRAALVGSGPVASLVESSVPLVAGDERRPVDLALVDAGAARRPANPLVDVRLPDRSSGLAMLRDLAVGTRVRGARDVAAAAAAGGLFYLNALADTDVVLAPRVRGFELSAVLRSARSPERIGVELALPAGTTIRRARHGGGFELLRGRQAVGAITAPVAWDADGTRVAVGSELRGDALELTVAHRDRDLRYPVVVDPEFASFSWTTTPPSDTNGWTYTEFDDFNESITGGLTIKAKPTVLICNEPVSAGAAKVRAHASVPPGCISGVYEYSEGAYGLWSYTAPPSTSIYRADFLGAQHTYEASCLREGLLSATGVNWLPGSWTALSAGVGGSSGSSPFTYCGAVPAESKQHCLLASCQPDPARPAQNRVGFQLSLPTGAFSNDSSIKLGGARIFVHDFNNPAISGLGHASDPAVWSGPPYRAMNPTVTDPGLGVKKLTVTWPAPSGAANSTSSTLACAGTRTDRCPTSHTQGIQWGDTLLEGQGTATFAVEDLVGNSASTSFTVLHDRTGPDLTLGGALYAARVGSATEAPIGAGTYGLTVSAADGTASPATPADRRAGVAKAQVFIKDSAGAWSLLQEWTNACGGDNCALPQQTFAFEPATQAEGVRTFRVAATDRAGNVRSQEFDASIDRNAPTVSLSGALPLAAGTTLQAGDHDLTATTADGSGTGVKEVEITVDGIRVDYVAQGCPTGGCTLTRGYTFPTDGFTPGQHTVEVTARDLAGKATKKPVVITVPESNSPPALGVGIEDFFNFRSFDTGAGSRALVNTANGNLVWHLQALSNRGRGLDTNVDVTYNALSSKEDLGHGYDEIGDGFSLSISTLTRLNEALDLRDVADGVITLTDADGTMHRFTKDAAGEWFNPPPGVNLRLRKFNPSPVTQDQFMKVWAATRPDGTTYFFDKCGYQRSVQDRNGNALVYEYEAVPPSEPYCFENTWAHRAKLRRVVDAAGADGTAPKADRSVTLTYTNEQTSGDPAAQVASITDHAGRRTTFAYTTTGHLRTITQAAGTAEQRTFAFGYEGEQATDNPCGTVRQPGSGRQDRDVVAIKDPRGNCTELDYLDDATLGGAPKFGLGERVNWLEDRRDNKTSFAYPSTVAPYKIDATDARGKLWKHESDSRFRLTKRTDPLGTATTYAYDGDNNLAEVREAAGTPDEALTRMTWNANGMLRTHTDPENHTTDLVYRDHAGVYLAATGADAGKGFVSDVLTVTTPRGVETATLGDFTTVYEVEPNGDVRSRTDEEGYRTQWDYTATGVVKEERAETERDQFSKTTYHDFDPNGLPQLVTDARGNATTTAGDGEWKLRYDRLGNVLDITDPRRAAAPTAAIEEPFTTEYEYDKLDRQVLERVPKDSAAAVFIERTTEYDANDNIKAVVDGNGARSTADYNAMDAPESLRTPPVPHEGEASPASEETRLRYDEEGNLLLETAPNGSLTATVDDYTTALTYDASGRPTAETRRSRGAEVKDLVTSYAYDRRGNLIGVADPRRNTTGDPAANAANATLRRHTFVYDKADRQVQAIERRLETDPVSQRRLITKLRYDADDNLVAEVDPRGTRLDPTDPEREIPDPALEARFTTEYRYDERGVLTDAIDPKDRRTHYDVRGDRQVRAITSPRGTASTGVSDDFVTSLEYDPMGDLIKRTLPRAPGQYGPSLSWNVSYVRDAVGNPTRIKDARDSDDPAATGFVNTFWDTGHLRTTERPGFWFYDEAADQLRERRLDDPPPDAVGSDQRTSDDAPGDFGRVEPEAMPDLLPKAGTARFGYDGEMRLASVRDAADNLQEIGRDALGRPTSRSWPFTATITERHGYDRNGNQLSFTDGEGKTTTYVFDQFDRLRSETRPGSAGPETTRYTLDENSNLTGLETPRNTAWTHRFDSIDRRVATIDPRSELPEPRRRTTFEYDPAGNLVSELPPRGQEVALPERNRYALFWQYDEANQLELFDAGRDHPGGETRRTTFGYDEDGNQVLVRTPGSKSGPGDTQTATRETRRRFDGRGLPWAETTGTGVHERTEITEFDGNGNLRRRVNPAGVRRSDELPRESGPAETDQPGVGSPFTEHATVFVYNGDNLLRSVYMPWGRKAAVVGDATDREAWYLEIERDGLGRVQDVMAPRQLGDPERVATHYTHYANGWIRTSRDRGSNPVTLTYEYDRRGFQTSWSNDKGRRITRTFFPNGLLEQRRAENTSADGKPGETRSYTYAYNPSGSMVRMVDTRPSESRTTEYAYDALERQTAVDERWKADRDTTYGYDDNGNVVVRRTDGEIDRPLTSPPPLTGSEPYNQGKVTRFDFDPQDRESRMDVSHPADPSQTRSRVTEYWPSNDVREWRRTRTGGATIVESRYFADDGRLLEKTRERSGAADTPRIYEYDDADNGSDDPSKWGDGRRSADERGTHVFNSRGHLVLWNRPADLGGGTVRYQVNGNGSIREATASVGSASATTRYIYDTGGDCSDPGNGRVGDRLTFTCTEGEQTAYEYDALGSLRRIDAPGGDADDTNYQFDVFERMISVHGPDEDAPTTYSYDGLDRRDYREKDGDRFEYGYVGSTEMLSRDEFLEDDGTTKRPRFFDYDSSLSRTGFSTGTTDLSRYRSYSLDANDSVERVEDAQGSFGVDTDGASSYRYDPYGEAIGPKPLAGSAAASNPFRFQGFYFDEAGQSYDMQARSYRPSLQRFLSADRYESAGMDLGLQLDPSLTGRYAFLGGNPIDNLEYDGHCMRAGDNGPCYPLGRAPTRRERARINEIVSAQQKAYDQGVRTLRREQRVIGQAAAKVATSPEHERLLRQVLDYRTAREIVSMTPEDVQEMIDTDRAREEALRIAGQQLDESRPSYWDYFKEFNKPDLSSPAGLFFTLCRYCKAGKLKTITKDTWKLPPVERGVTIEKALGKNTPGPFPVVDRWDKLAGKVTSIKSVDPRLKTYRNPARLRSRVRSDIDKVASFKGRLTPSFEVPGDEIRRRGLDLVLPSRTGTLAQRRELWKLRRYARDAGVELRVIRAG